MKNVIGLYLGDLVGDLGEYGRGKGRDLEHYVKQIKYGERLLEELQKSDLPKRGKKPKIKLIKLVIKNYRKIISYG